MLHRNNHKPANEKCYVNNTDRTYNTTNWHYERICQTCQKTDNSISFIDTKPGSDSTHKHCNNDSGCAIEYDPVDDSLIGRYAKQHNILLLNRTYFDNCETKNLTPKDFRDMYSLEV